MPIEWAGFKVSGRAAAVVPYVCRAVEGSGCDPET